MAKFLSGRTPQLNVGVSSSTENVTVLQVTGKVGIGTTNAGSRNLYVIGDVETTGVTTLASSGGITTTGGDLYVGGDLFIKDDLFFDEFTARNANISGIATINNLVATAGTITTLNATTGIITNITGVAATITTITNTNLSSGIGTITTLNATTGIITNITGVAATITTLVATATSLSQLQVTGISTFSNGPVFIGSGTSTGTASQRLQVTGGAYISGSIGIGTTSPRETMDVVGTIGVQASGSANRFYIQHNVSQSSLDFIFV